MGTRIFLGLNAALFIGYGLVCLAWPAVVADAAGLGIRTGDGSAELRAMYGGLQTAVGMLALGAVVRSDLQRLVLFVFVFLFFGLASGRLIGLLVDAGTGSYTYGALAYEAVCAVLSLVLLGPGIGSEQAVRSDPSAG